MFLECKGEDTVKQTAGDISSAAVTDSAVYYCALQPTNAEPKETTCCNLKQKRLLLKERQFSLVFFILEIIIFIWLTSVILLLPPPHEGHTAPPPHEGHTAPPPPTRWYRQYQRSRPEFLLYITEAGVIHPTESDFSAHIDKTEKRVDLEIISAAVTDSAVYYCALRPTVTGNTNTLYKNLWRKTTQYCTTSTRGSLSLTNINRKKRVDLQISSAAVTDSAVFYCAVKPTVTGNTNTLYKNLWSKDNTILHNIHQRESLSDKHQ
ncbi:hypothetical protein F7725_010832 [Dissostichus mawsoni]|uniref:Immunoglobulin V-set domain-containing protein n=1 Tax=Dissostichus mawsoni TaxID=36200 RepID=A0A7J5Z8Y8_DISMA|nr:hypothetical protein F7725_010832 [Dissostichus mawsoni]